MPLCIYKTRFEKTGHKNAETPDFSGVSGECIYFGHSIWLRNRDLNPNKQSQSLSCYRYTIPQYKIVQKSDSENNYTGQAAVCQEKIYFFFKRLGIQQTALVQYKFKAVRRVHIN